MAECNHNNVKIDRQNRVRMCCDCGTAWAMGTMRKPKKRFETLLKCDCNPTYGLTYQKCRFCPASWPEVKHLWKYAVRHYICDSCLIKALEKRRMSDWSQREESVYSQITGQESLTDIRAEKHTA